VAQFLPEACITANHPYKLALNDFLCSQCKSKQPYIGVTTFADDADGNTQKGINLYICDNFAKQLYSKSNDTIAAKIDLESPTTVFDSCGYLS
jgi:hypothetical protein